MMILVVVVRGRHRVVAGAKMVCGTRSVEGAVGWSFNTRDCGCMLTFRSQVSGSLTCHRFDLLLIPFMLSHVYCTSK